MLSGLRLAARRAHWRSGCSIGCGLPLLLGVDPASAAGAVGVAPATSAVLGAVAGAWALVAAGSTSATLLELTVCGLVAAFGTFAWFRWQARRCPAPARPADATDASFMPAQRLVDAPRAPVAAVRAAAGPPDPRSGPSWLPRSPLALPAGLTSDDLIAAAKRDFVRMQAAWDARDIATLRHLTLPQLLDELLGVLAAQEVRGPQQTDVLTLHADLLACDAVGADYLASIEFSGLIRESPDANAAPFRELWLLARPRSEASDWRLARQQALL
ncbi:MAG: Tim44-like domain-containing protein [Caldimonas sp.]